MKTIASFILGALFASTFITKQINSQEKGRECFIWFYPINAQTFGPIGERAIESFYDVSSLLHPKEKELKELLLSAEIQEPFDNSECRLKVKSDGETFLLDSHGVVKSSKGEFALSLKKKEELLRLLRARIPRIGEFRKQR